MKNLCIIPARGGSKRIPRKNIIDFLGKPLIAYSIENALNSGIFDEVKRVLDSRNEKYMDYMFFRARNGDNMNLNSFADTACVLFDDPHICLIRYDRLMKEAQMTRM